MAVIVPRGLLERLRAAFGRPARDELGDLSEFLTGSRGGGFPLGIDVIEDPSVPPGAFLLGAHGLGARFWDVAPTPTLREPLWPPAPLLPADRRAWSEVEPAMPRSTYETERSKALGFLEDQLDGLCDHYSIDRQVWRGPRLEATRRLAFEARRFTYEAEARVAMSIVRPTEFVTFTGV